MTKISELLEELLGRIAFGILCILIVLSGRRYVLVEGMHDPTRSFVRMPETPEAQHAMILRMSRADARRFVERLPRVWVNWDEHEHDALVDALIDRPHVSPGCCIPDARCRPCSTATTQWINQHPESVADERSRAAAAMIAALATLPRESRYASAIPRMTALSAKVRSREAYALLSKHSLPIAFANRLIESLHPAHRVHLLWSPSNFPAELRPALIRRLDAVDLRQLLEHSPSLSEHERAAIRRKLGTDRIASTETRALPTSGPSENTARIRK